MKTKMNVSIILYPDLESGFKGIDLYNRLKVYIPDVNVTDLGEKVYIFATVDITNDAVESIIRETKKCGECDIEAYMVNDEAP